MKGVQLTEAGEAVRSDYLRCQDSSSIGQKLCSECDKAWVRAFTARWWNDSGWATQRGHSGLVFWNFANHFRVERVSEMTWSLNFSRVHGRSFLLL